MAAEDERPPGSGTRFKNLKEKKSRNDTILVAQIVHRIHSLLTTNWSQGSSATNLSYYRLRFVTRFLLTF